MSNESREHLSCFMDGEISKETGRFLVRRLGADSELRHTWARYHLVRDCLRHQEGDLVGISLCGRVQQALANESPQTAPGRIAAGWSASNWTKAGWLKPVAGMAVAASVALMAIITVGPGQNPVSTPTGELAGSPQAESFVSPNNILTRSPRPQQVSVLGGTGNSNRKMNSYLLRHYQVTGSTGGKGFVTFVPIVVTQAAAQSNTRADPQRGAEDGEDSLAGDSPDKASLDRESLDRANESPQ
jgi:sigma-E factor negative regulatory protein RseA